MEERGHEIIQDLRKAIGDDDACERLKKELIQLSEAHGRGNVVQFLESEKRTERLPVQWELEEVIEVLIPPKEAEEPIEDDPGERRLRASELLLVYSDPRGIRLLKSKVDDRWVLMQMDPRTGGMMQQELTGAQGDELKMQLADSPYWVAEP
jgi:hypothetical protein